MNGVTKTKGIAPYTSTCFTVAVLWVRKLKALWPRAFVMTNAGCPFTLSSAADASCFLKEIAARLVFTREGFEIEEAAAKAIVRGPLRTWHGLGRGR